MLDATAGAVDVLSNKFGFIPVDSFDGKRTTGAAATGAVDILDATDAVDVLSNKFGFIPVDSIDGSVEILADDATGAVDVLSNKF